MSGILQPAVEKATDDAHEELLIELQGLIRGYQRDIDRVDQALAQRLGANRTDLAFR